MITIRQETPRDAAAREALLDAAYGPARFTKTSARLRAGRLAAHGLSFVATERGRLVGTVRLWDIAVGAGRPALLLGPLAVRADCRNRGIGTALVQHALDEARRQDRAAVLLVGDAPYYGRFGFSDTGTGGLRMPGPYERHRLLGCELREGALDGAHGLIRATGARVPLPASAAAANKSKRPARAA
jgi:predicted N-acetyltransferase YhbS